MAAFLTASLVLALLVFSSNASGGNINITAEPGENVTLTCRTAENKTVIVVQWNRTYPGSSQCVLKYRKKGIDEDNHSPSFSSRVDLLDFKKGNASLVLKNVTTDDTGTYKCQAFYAKNNRRKRSLQDTEPISTIDLKVEPGNKEKQKMDGGNKNEPKEDGRNWTGLIVGLPVLAVVALLVLVLYKRSRGSSQRSKRPPAAADVEKKLTGPDESNPPC